MSQWFVLENNKPTGPFDLASMQQRVRKGELNAKTMICRVGGSEWVQLSTDELLRPPAAPSAPRVRTSPTGGESTWDVAATARNHRFLMMCFVGMLLSLIGILIMSLAGSQSAGLLSFPYWGCAIGAMVFTCLTLVAMRVHVALVIVAAVMLLAPCLNIIVLLVISQMVQSRLRGAGLVVGFLGVSPDSLQARGYRR